MADELLTGADDPGLVPLRPVAVLAALDCGRDELALRLIERWGTEVRDDWAAGFLHAVWGLVSARLGVPDPEPLYDLLLPFADQLIVCGMGMVGWGCHHLVLAELAHRMGRTALAVEHANASLRRHRHLGLDHWAARCRDLLAAVSG